MQTALKINTRVLPGHRVEIVAPELADGQPVEVLVIIADTPVPIRPVTIGASLTEFLDSLPPGPRSAPTWEEIERNLQEDRDSWDR